MGSQTHMVWENGRLCFYSDLANCPSSALSLNSCLNPIVWVGAGAHLLLLRLYHHNSLLRCKTILHLLNQSPVNSALLSYNFSPSYNLPFLLFNFFISSPVFWCPAGCVWFFTSQDAKLSTHSHHSPALHSTCCSLPNIQINVILRNRTLFCPQHPGKFWLHWWCNNWLEKVFSFCDPKRIKLEMYPQCSPSRISTLFVLEVFHDTEPKLMCLLRNFVAWLKTPTGSFQCGKFQRIILWVFQL